MINDETLSGHWCLDTQRLLKIQRECQLKIEGEQIENNRNELTSPEATASPGINNSG